MALFAHDMFDTESGARPPISMHPAFPAIVALWFAVLLGIGRLILPNLLVERLVGASGIGALVPVANPPLGWTAHSLIAVFAAAAGALAGLAIARRVVRAHKASEMWDDEEFTITGRGPISVRDEVESDGVINGRGLPVTNLRALAIAGDESAEDVLYTAPLPGERIAEAVADEFEPGEEDLRSEQPADFVEEHWFARDPRGGGEVPSGRVATLDDDWKTGSIEGLGMVELAGRLGASLQKRREWLAQAKAISEAAAGRLTPSGLDAAAPEDAARATAAYFGGAQRRVSPRPADTPALPDADAALRDALAAIRRVTGAA